MIRIDIVQFITVARKSSDVVQVAALLCGLAYRSGFHSTPQVIERTDIGCARPGLPAVPFSKRRGKAYRVGSQVGKDGCR